MYSGIQSWKNLLIYGFSAFSIPLLLKTLFLPWKMDSVSGSYYSFFEKFVFAVFSRVFGLFCRLVLIIIGLIFTFFIFLTFPIFLILPIKIKREDLQTLPSFGSTLSYGNTYFLNKHGEDIFGSSRIKLFGKDRSLRMVERGLAKDTNHNVLLIGEPGVGKRTLISHLALLSKSGLSFDGIRFHRIVDLFVEGINLNDLEECLKEAASALNVILVIKNIHLYESIYEKLMPYLTSPNLGIIVTTDFTGYNNTLKNYPEFLQKFEKVDVGETNYEDTLSILKNKIYLNHISIKNDAVEEIVKLGNRLIGNQSEPVKSISILEELCTLKKTITIEDVRQIVSDRTNMPIGAIGMDERKVLLELEGSMKKKIIGQDEAVSDVAEALRRLRTGIADHSKPAGSFLFLGPTGVGKTYTAKILAESYFGRKDAMIRFDMSEFSLPDSVNTFSDRITSVIEEMPLSLVFFDELEKANKAIHNLMLQILDEGRLTNTKGREASFKEAIIITTSNAGSDQIIENPNLVKKDLINILIKRGIFAPEFLNRFSSIILFKPLDQSQAKQVTALLIKEFAGRLFEDKGITLVVNDALIERVASAGFDKDFGARPIKRAMEQIVENKVAEYIMAGNVGGTLEIK